MNSPPEKHDGGFAPSCDFCGLPVPGARVEPGEPLFCCWGCGIASRVSQSRGETGETRWMLARIGLSLFFTMNVMVFSLALWSQPTASVGEADSALHDLFRYLCLLFTVPVLLLVGRPLIENALSQLTQRRPNTDLLLAAGVTAAFLFSLYSLWTNIGHVYFEVCCVVPLAVMLGRWFEAGGKLQATAALRALQQLLPESARVYRQEAWATLPLEMIVAGDRLRFLPGERIAVDGEVLSGGAAVDEQLLTGESHPRTKEPGDRVYSGTLCLDGELQVRAAGPAASGFLQQIVDAVIAAVSRKSRYTRLADRVASWFLLLVVVTAAGVFTVHLALRGWESAILAVLSVLLIACPCALGLATPLVLWAAVGRASQAQVVVREGDALSRLAAAGTILFDKTGTLTSGQPRVMEARTAAGSAPRDISGCAAALAARSLHPYSRAITTYVQVEYGEVPEEKIREFQQFPGRGLWARADVDGEELLLGSARLMREKGQCDDTGLLDVEPLSAEGAAVEGATQTHLFFAAGGRVLARFVLEEEIRPEARLAIAQLRERDYRLQILTGDAPLRAAAVGAALGIPAFGGLLPEDKLKEVREARGAGSVVMVGDGINDSPALAAAEVGVALGCGADVARQSSEICLLTDDLTRLPWLLELAGASERTIRWNLVWALGYNTVGIGLAALGWLHPFMAAAAMAVSSFLVIGNSLRLAAFPGPGLLPMPGPANAESAARAGNGASSRSSGIREPQALAAATGGEGER